MSIRFSSFVLPYLFAFLTLTAPIFSAHADTARLVTQSTSSDCGPAALATLLTYYLDTPATESEITRLAGTTAAKGTSLQGLQDAAAAKGCGADSFRMDYGTLRRQLEAYPAPVIVRLLLPEPHFVLVLAADEKYVALADPAVGNYLFERKSFEKRWVASMNNEGYVFVAAREDGNTNVRNRDLTLKAVLRAQRLLQSGNPPAVYGR
jgi:predicted double-glycine peptidase